MNIRIQAVMDAGRFLVKLIAILLFNHYFTIARVMSVHFNMSSREAILCPRHREQQGQARQSLETLGTTTNSLAMFAMKRLRKKLQRVRGR